MWLIYYNTGLLFCFKSMSAYHLYGNQVIPRKIQNGTAHLDITLSRFYQKDQNFLYHLFGLPVPGFMLREMDKFTGILLLIQLNPIPVFGAKKITVHVPYDRKIFIESSIKMVSAQCLLLFLLHTYMCVYTLIIWLPFQPTTEPKVDNIRMAGYMEKLPVKSNQKKVQSVMKNPAMSIVHWSHSPIPRLILRLCKGRLHQERCLHLDDRNFILTT